MRRHRKKIKLAKVLASGATTIPTQHKDLAYFWAAYKKGAFNAIPDVIENASPDEFTAWFEDWAQGTFGTFFRDDDGAWQSAAVPMWTFWVKDKPVGFVVCWLHESVLIGGMAIWFPWASPRQIISAAASFLHGLATSDTMTMIEFAHEKDGPFFNRMMDWGLMRRVGTAHSFTSGERTLVYEVRNERHIRRD